MTIVTGTPPESVLNGCVLVMILRSTADQSYLGHEVDRLGDTTMIVVEAKEPCEGKLDKIVS